MYLRVKTLAIITLFIVPSLLHAFSEGKPAPVTVVIDDFELRDVSSDRVVFEVRSSVTASRKLKLNRVRFERTRLQGMPIYLAPVEQHLQLESGVPTALPPVLTTIYLRDLDSLVPLEEAVHDGKATVTGDVIADLDLNLAERIAARQWNASGEMPVKLTVPIEVPGGAAGRLAALATLQAAQLAMSVGGSAVAALGLSQSAWEQQLRTTIAPALVVAESRYSLRLKSGERVDLVVRGMGFRTSEDAFVLTGEIVEPWKYDTDVAAALQTAEATLLDDGRDLLVWPFGEARDAASARSLARGSVKVEHVSSKKATVDVLVDGKTIKVQVLRRDSDSNYALLRFTRPQDKGNGAALAPASARQLANWDRTAIFHAGDGAALETVIVPSHRENGRIVLGDPVDDRSFGSLVMIPEGALGMVQDENSAMLLRTEW
jgi:hypothetical protein